MTVTWRSSSVSLLPHLRQRAELHVQLHVERGEANPPSDLLQEEAAVPRCCVRYVISLGSSGSSASHLPWYDRFRVFRRGSLLSLLSAMVHTEGEATPLLHGRAATSGGPRAGAAAVQHPAGGGRRSHGSRQRPELFSMPRSRRLTLAVAAVVTAVLVIAVAALVSTSGQAASSQGGDKSPAAASPRHRGDSRGPAAGGNVEAGRRDRDGSGSRSDASKEPSGAWRSQPHKPPGFTANVERDGNKQATPTSTTKPNVFFFLIDDMGYGDIGYQSTDLSQMTPNLDKLAAGGVKLTNYYSMALCTPARASIMTGRYPVRYGMQYAVIQPGAPWGLPLNEKILPQYMNEAGYESHMVGKWHLGSHKQTALPNQRGFKSFLGYLGGADTYYTHKVKITMQSIENHDVELEGKFFFDFGYGNSTGYHDLNRLSASGMSCSDGRGGPSWDDDSRDSLDPADVCYTGTYSTDIFVGRARQIVQAKTPFDEEPLFLYLAHQAVHSPIGPAPWDSFTPEEQDLLNAVRARTGSDNRARFAGVLMFLDKRIGAFVDMLEQEGWLENSVIVVASDNGACPSSGGSNYPLRGTKSSVYEGGRKVPAFVWSKSHLPPEVWGTTYDKMMHSTDWLPTLASLVGAELSGSAGALDGTDQWPWLTGGGLEDVEDPGDSSNDPRTEMLYSWDSYLMQEGRNLTQGAYRLGDWKLLLNVWCSGYYSHDLAVIEYDPLLNPSVTCRGTGECEDCLGKCQLYPDTYAYGNRLFNLRDDPREEHDLYDQYPEIVEQIRQRADEVVYSEWTVSEYLPVNTDSYEVFVENGWWILPWEEILEEESS